MNTNKDWLQEFMSENYETPIQKLNELLETKDSALKMFEQSQILLAQLNSQMDASLSSLNHTVTRMITHTPKMATSLSSLQNEIGQLVECVLQVSKSGPKHEEARAAINKLQKLHLIQTNLVKTLELLQKSDASAVTEK
ncbi:hypothetical protein SJAG_03571 [Schizosaccharomyces japonicus yFS275]|uniref:Uncharacterized protein n=1 Tax=Schizosaccharomyces japonicus (strain yFS275 / FY16936) TaxID=402676 RepID=B6K4K8_SCHJY|nr:hypothetical protein SJAG_03571 [Schizosaccharomyces japonicus yFS275]EEB08415.2 hypothetical protein SJAG_03571 [Schizosaccharomyces japonicus yFS275]